MLSFQIGRYPWRGGRASLDARGAGLMPAAVQIFAWFQLLRSQILVFYFILQLCSGEVNIRVIYIYIGTYSSSPFI